jgi:hypothetical protein
MEYDKVLARKLLIETQSAKKTARIMGIKWPQTLTPLRQELEAEGLLKHRPGGRPKSKQTALTPQQQALNIPNSAGVKSDNLSQPAKRPIGRPRKDSRPVATPAAPPPSNGNGAVIVRGKKLSINEILEALPLAHLVPNLTERQINDIAFKVMEKSLRADNLEKLFAQAQNQLAAARDRIKYLEGENARLKQGSIKDRILQSGTGVIHGD